MNSIFKNSIFGHWKKNSLFVTENVAPVVQSPMAFEPLLQSRSERKTYLPPQGPWLCYWQKETMLDTLLEKLSFPTLQSTYWGATIELLNSFPFERKCVIFGELPIIFNLGRTMEEPETALISDQGHVVPIHPQKQKELYF